MHSANRPSGSGSLLKLMNGFLTTFFLTPYSFFFTFFCRKYSASKYRESGFDKIVTISSDLQLASLLLFRTFSNFNQNQNIRKKNLYFHGMYKKKRRQMARRMPRGDVNVAMGAAVGFHAACPPVTEAPPRGSWTRRTSAPASSTWPWRSRARWATPDAAQGGGKDENEGPLLLGSATAGWALGLLCPAAAAGN